MKYWDTIKHTVLHVVCNFFQNNQLLQEQIILSSDSKKDWCLYYSEFLTY